MLMLFDSADVAVSRYSMTSVERAFLLGQSLASTGGSISSSADVAPYITLLYKAPIKVNSIKGYRYGVIYKTMFTPPDENIKGLDGKPDLSQVPKIVGAAQPTEWSFVDGTTNKHPWEYHVDTTDLSFPVDIDTTWFLSVPVPSIGALLPITLASSVPTNNAVVVVLTTHPVLTFSNSMADVSGLAFVNVTDGTLVGFTGALDITGKILTITPTANLLTTKVYNLILIGETDAYGQILAPQIIRFTAA